MTDADRILVCREIWARAYETGETPEQALWALEREAKARLRARDTLPAPPRDTVPAPTWVEQECTIDGLPLI